MRLTTALALPLALSLCASSVAGQTCTVTPYGPACGVEARGSARPNGATVRVSFTLFNAAPNTPILFMVGVNPVNIRLPIGDCSLLVDFVFVQNHRTGADGTYTFSKALPNGNVGDARIQFATIENGDELVVKTSNGLLLECR